MNSGIKGLLCGLALVTVSHQAWVRQETWRLTYWPAPWLTEIKSTWRVTISDTGRVSGVSTWDARDSSGHPNLSGRTNTIDGRIGKNGDITLIRHLAGRDAGKTQRYTGVYTHQGRGAKGNTTGFAAPGSWVASVRTD